MHAYVHVCMGIHRILKREWELEVVVSCLIKPSE